MGSTGGAAFCSSSPCSPPLHSPAHLFSSLELVSMAIWVSICQQRLVDKATALRWCGSNPCSGFKSQQSSGKALGCEQGDRVEILHGLFGARKATVWLLLSFYVGHEQQLFLYSSRPWDHLLPSVWGFPSARQMGSTGGAASSSSSPCSPPLHSPAHRLLVWN